MAPQLAETERLFRVRRADVYEDICRNRPEGYSDLRAAGACQELAIAIP